MATRSSEQKASKSRSRRPPAVVAIGGGSGLAVVLRGLEEIPIPDLSAVVTMSDDGGSSGRLRREYGVLPPGDIRNCLSALAGDEDLLARLFMILLMNLMTQPGETDRLSASDHLAAIEKHAGGGLVDAVLVNSARLSRRAVRLYASTGARPVSCDRGALRRHTARVVEADLLAPGDLIRHDPKKLATAALSVGTRLAQRMAR